MEANKASNRIEYFDTAKAYLILLVVLGHVLIILNPSYEKLYFSAIQSFINTFHMPAFFIINGILFNNEKWEKTSSMIFVKSRVRSLLIPYLFFEIVGISWKMLFEGQSLMKGIYNFITIRCNVGADWFLPAMFMGSLLFLCYVKNPVRIGGIAIMMLCFISPIFMAHNQLTVVLGRAILACGFIMIGNIGKKIFLNEKVKSLPCMIISLMVTGIMAIIALKFGGNDFYTCIINNPITLVVGGISGTLLILGASQWIGCKMINVIGKHTLTIMGTHQLVIYGLVSIMPQMRGGSLVHGLLMTVVIFVFELIAVYIIDLKFPFLVGK